MRLFKLAVPVATAALLSSLAVASSSSEISLLRPYLRDFENFCEDALDSRRCDAINDIGDYQREGETREEACDDLVNLVTRCERDLDSKHVACRIFDALAEDFCEGVDEEVCGELDPNQTLRGGESIVSCDGRFEFIMQGDGNLVLYQGRRALWASGTEGNPGAVAVMQGDGNLVVYGRGGDALWDSGTWGNPGAELVVQDDGNVVIYDEGEAIWATDTCCR